MNKKKLLIIGAGLSGLYAAYLLQEEYDITVVEARDIVGGRVMNVGGHDLGPSWVWGHQKNILELTQFLNLELEEQYTKGNALYDSPEGVQRFNSPASAPSARIVGGVSALIDALHKKLNADVILNTQVIELCSKDNKVEVITNSHSYEVDYVVSTLPPGLAVQSIGYNPVLPKDIIEKFENIPTWMGYSAKCVIEFEEAFWKEEGLSGFAFSHVGPLGEVHDACTKQSAALFGFLSSNAKMQNIEEQVVNQLLRVYGEKAANPKNIYIVDWKNEVYTSTKLDAQPLREHPQYGFDVSHFDGKLIFSGTESSFKEGGYLEGALLAAKSIKAKLS